MADDYVTKQYLDQALEKLRNELQEFGRDLQSELLRGFAGFSRTFDVRLRNVEDNTATDTAAMKKRLAEVETRLLEVEKKLMQRPPAG